jgi:uncharacterized protein YjbI with pentapeptide repeats
MYAYSWIFGCREDGLSEVILQLLMTIKERISSIRKSATLQNLEMPGRHELSWIIGISVAALFIGFAIGGGASWYEQHREALAPILTLMAGIAVAGVALMRHFAQTDADRQRQITKNYSKAVEQLGSDKIEMHLGGIYTLERISHESPYDYWTVMETLCAFVRERARRKAPEKAPSGIVIRHYQRSESRPPTDIAAVLSVIARRDKKNQQRERENEWHLDFREADLSNASLRKAPLRGADLSGADLNNANLSGADLSGADLSGADLSGAHLSWADLSGAHLRRAHFSGVLLFEANLSGADLRGTLLSGAHLSGANLSGAYLHGADLNRADLNRADLRGAHLRGANLSEADLSKADLRGAHLRGVLLFEANLSVANLRGTDLFRAHLGGADLSKADLRGADLRRAQGLLTEQLADAIGDAKTLLPDGVPRPANWPIAEL